MGRKQLIYQTGEQKTVNLTNMRAENSFSIKHAGRKQLIYQTCGQKTVNLSNMRAENS